MADLGMLRREILVGYGVAGFLAVLVPVHIWGDLFLRGHGFATTLENALVGPFIAIISFVCSIGNVPLAAALWKGGISFGGVVSFIFADLITMPLLVIYRKLYGGRMALRMLGLFWCVMSLAGLATEGLFRLAGLVPTARPSTIVAEHFSWGYTSILDIFFLAVFGLLWALAHKRQRLGGGSRYATDPVCGMQVEIAHAAESQSYAGSTVYFCSGHCRERFSARAAGSGTGTAQTGTAQTETAP
jgi:YHS domain-containing protein